ncbi:FAD-dependent monooxygenase [Streptomyces sp. NBC_00525]|uniref:FAD-dependent monooxygenase n=1 Tax=Streptomyces sp. NBC_00525 TaxID=2903660 RepID=UPI002E805700|nr:FAD-dependent monooxygenase [Streptomyces sp. NBC_00525]WUC98049.1 FAD-dependent monooxygenase [Streptomyces sp. NBC_00525]
MKGTAADADVIVVGAGPTGLMLAGELRLGGARVVVIEKLAAPTGQSRGLGFTARAMEVFDERGLLPRFGQGDTLATSPMGHFGGAQFDFTVLEDAHFGARGIPQGETEAVLEGWAVELGADVRRGWEFLSLADGFLDGDHAEITVRTPEGTEQHLRAAYLVAADGGASRVRRAAGFDFPGTDATQGMYLADVTGCALRPRFLGERLNNGMVMAAPLAEGVDRIIVCPDGTPAHDRERTVTFEEVAAAWQSITGEDISHGGADWVSSFTNATRQASEYRRGRVFVAGDAAHIHLPAGGQGLSTGVQDASNLGWKLAAVARGDAPEELLDTYHAERWPVGRRLLANTRAQGVVFLGGAEADPLRELFAELVRYDDVKRHLAGAVSHLDIRYDLGAGEDAHPLVGRRMPPRPLIDADGGRHRVAQLLRTGRAVLLDLADDVAVRGAAAGHRGRLDVHTVSAKPVDGPDVLAGAGALLVRPDGYVAWAGGSAQGLTAALERWLGPAES